MGRSKETKTVTEVWGLSGGIASGKSTAAKYFAELGIPILDADQISRGMSSNEAVKNEITQRFGTADREKLREIVFQDPSALKDLEGILHPHIIRESNTEIDRLKRESPSSRVIIYEATLLVETERYKAFSGLIVVESTREIQKQRLISRSGFPEELAEQILNAQFSDELRRKAATIVIQNLGSVDELKAKVHEISLARRWISS